MARKLLCYYSIDMVGSFGQTLLQGVSERAARHGLDLFIVHGGTIESPNEWESKRNTLYRWTAAGRFDAFLVSSIFSYVTPDFIAEFLKPLSVVPTVTMVARAPGVPCVEVDNSTGFRDLLSRLIDAKEDASYAVITGPAQNPDSMGRFHTLGEVMDGRGIAIGPERTCSATFDSLSAVDAVGILLDERKLFFDTLICFNDSMAIAAIEELKRRGLRVPEDVRVTGFDNLYGAAFTDPPLATVAYPVRELGETGVDLIAEMLDGRQAPPLTMLSTRFVPRLSAGFSASEPRPDSLVVSKAIMHESEERFLLQIGEDVGTTFDLSSISQTLARYCRHIGIHTCFVVIYSDESMERARLLARIEDREERSVEGFGEFAPRDILPRELIEAHPSLVMEALYARSEDIGYILFNPGDHPSILYKSLRQQISLAVKGAQLVSTINRYSEGLEAMVRERTASLAQRGEELGAEIKRRKHAEMELLKQRNLESLGLLAGGIAHDFNNILTAISGNLSMLSIDDVEAAGRRALYAGMAKAVENAKSLTGQLLAFSKGGAPIKKATSILPLIKETAMFTLRGSNVKPEFLFAGSVWDTEIDADQISQVMNNLILNAVHAMPNGGTLTFSAESVSVPAGDRWEVRPGRYVKISIADSGHGIPAEIIDKIFDPYFTTKEKGSGLGLSTSPAIARNHGGTISVSSAVGEGTVFDVYLPASEKKAIASRADAVADLPPGLRVLVLEDDPQVRHVLSAFLKKASAEAVITTEGKEAVRRYAEALDAGARFDLLIMDLTIPGGMGGRDAMAHILEIDPEARGIVSSGYSDVPVLAESGRYGFHAILKKPFTFNEFMKAAAEALS